MGVLEAKKRCDFIPQVVFGFGCNTEILSIKLDLVGFIKAGTPASIKSIQPFLAFAFFCWGISNTQSQLFATLSLVTGHFYSKILANFIAVIQ